MRDRSYSFSVLVVELILTVCVCSAAVLANISIVKNEAKQYTSEIRSDYHNLADGYISVFKAVTILVKEKADQDPSFEEMNGWLQSHNEVFKEAVGPDIFDGFAMTYKGGYAHSWNYGDYSNYDPNTRPWYQEAKKSGGKVVVVAPYVTFLDPSYLNSDQYIEMTIAQKYSDSISFDLDLKISEIHSLLTERNMEYNNSTLLLFDQEGYILSSNRDDLYCHNINVPDDSVSENMSENLRTLKSRPEDLIFGSVNGRWQFLYALQDADENTYCVLIPFEEMFLKIFLPVMLIMIMLILLEIVVYERNKQIIKEMSERDRRITEIAQVAFQKQIFVDLDTMKCVRSGDTDGIASSEEYDAVYRYLYQCLSEETARGEFEECLAPKALGKLENKGLIRKKFSFDLPNSDGAKIKKVLEFSLFVSSLNGKKMAAVLGNDVTDKERDQQRILQAISHYYSAVFVGNAQAHTLDTIKTNPYFEAVFIPGTDISELNHRFTEQFVREEYVADYLEFISFGRIEKELNKSDSCSITVALKDGHWHTVRILRSEAFEENREFIFFVENSDEQMRQQEILRKALEEATEATRAKTDFLSRMSHDIRTPMNGIIGMTRIAQGQENPAKTADCLRKIDISSAYLLGLINDILDMTKIESGKFQLHPEPYSADELRQYLNSVIRPLCEGRHQSFSVSCRVAEEYLPLLDKLRINQIIFNLLSNAVKYTQEGGSIECSVGTEITEGKMTVFIQVKDNGKGMSPGFQKVLFEPYTQEDRVRTIAYNSSSSGLGLAIVKKIVDLMGGTIEVESEENKGSIFTVRLNVDYVSASECEDTEKKRDIAFYRDALSGKRALICEDNQINQEIARSILEQADVLVEPADNGMTGIQKFRSAPEGYYDWVLMDIRMPAMDGYETTKAIRSLPRRDAGSVPIIAMTADAFEDDIRKCLDVGMNGHIPKPLSPRKVYEILFEWVEKVLINKG